MKLRRLSQTFRLLRAARNFFSPETKWKSESLSFCIMTQYIANALFLSVALSTSSEIIETMKITILAGVGLVILGPVEVILTSIPYVCTGPTCSVSSSNSLYFTIGVVLAVFGLVLIVLSRFEHQPRLPKIQPEIELELGSTENR